MLACQRWDRKYRLRSGADRPIAQARIGAAATHTACSMIKPATKWGATTRTSIFPIPEVTLKHRVENRSHRAGTARTGDFRRFSAAFAGPAGPPGAIDFVFRAFVWLRWQMP